nr:hypothetical protein CFP56_34151 [Quercus suber]
MRLRSLQRRHKSIRDWRLDTGAEVLGRGEPLERDAEAKLESSALERVRRIGMGLDTSLAELAGGRGQKRRRHM